MDQYESMPWFEDGYNSGYDLGSGTEALEDEETEERVVSQLLEMHMQTPEAADLAVEIRKLPETVQADAWGDWEDGFVEGILDGLRGEERKTSQFG